MTDWQRLGAALVIGWCVGGLAAIAYLAWWFVR